MMKLEWEDIDGWHQRAKVYGGWLVKAIEPVAINTGSEIGTGWDCRISICFVPDANHEWNIKEAQDG